MKLILIITGTFGLLLLGGFATLMVMDAPVHKQAVVKTIPNDRLF